MPGSVGGKRSAVFNTSDLEILTDECADGSITTLSIVLAASTTVSSYLDVKGSDATGTDHLGEALGCLHCGISGRLVLAALNHHTTADAADGLGTRQIGNVDEGIVPTGKDMDYTKYFLVLTLPGKIHCIILGLFSCLHCGVLILH